MTSFASAWQGRAALGGVVCIGLTAVIVILGAGQIRGREAAGGTDFTLEVPDASIIPPADGEDDIPKPLPSEKDGEASNSPVDTQSDGVAQAAPPGAPADTQPDIPSEPSNAPPTAAEPVALARPIVLAAGRFSIGGKVLELDGIVPIAVNRQCTDTSGEAWPCGRMARTAFANLVRGRTIDCDVPSAEWSGTAIAHCTLAGRDLSQWLAENGWAEVRPGFPLAAIAEAARQAGRGLYSPDPRRKAKSQDGAGNGAPMDTQQQQP
ncbi:thermonuclease family protein [Rhizobium sp. ARZ01]|uniref:thermonuclease family protein n=1 Tax=Rhizobium sp. ARZ01 TaxID=2769313 RepID=UPI00177AE705|nr:thermonuclease family protein [Rhizobium sp. ARZ01]MBD9373980.1 thermonuclease family protein [Rhizobium sp. ARZ01]